MAINFPASPVDGQIFADPIGKLNYKFTTADGWQLYVNTSTALPANSVGSTQVIDGSLTPADLAPMPGLTAGSYGNGLNVPTVSVNGVGEVTAISTSPIPAFVQSGATHAAGLVPDPGSVAGTTRFLREDTNWVDPLAFGAAFGASGPAHAKGLVPDPGATAGTLRYLREDSTWANVPAGPAVTSAAPVAMNWTYLGSTVQGRIYAFAGAVAGTPMALGTIAGIAKIVRSSGWVGDGTNQYPIGATGSGLGSSCLIKLNGSNVTIDTGVSGIDRGEVMVEYV